MTFIQLKQAHNMFCYLECLATACTFPLRRQFQMTFGQTFKLQQTRYYTTSKASFPFRMYVIPALQRGLSLSKYQTELKTICSMQKATEKGSLLAFYVQAWIDLRGWQVYLKSWVSQESQ